MVIDIHCHVFPEKIALRASESIGAFYGITAMRFPGSVPALLQAMDEGGVDRALIHSVALSPERAATINDFIAGQVTQHPDRLTGFAALHPDMPHPEDELRRALALGLRGVKIHSDMQAVALNDPRMDRIYDACQDVCPMILHMGDKRYAYDNPSLIPGVLRRFPRLRLLCAHMGGYSEWQEAEEYLLHEDVLVDCSSSFFALGVEGMRNGIRRFGAERVLFGSDFPMWDPGEELRAVRSLGLTARELDLVTHQNALSFLGLNSKSQE